MVSCMRAVVQGFPLPTEEDYIFASLSIQSHEVADKAMDGYIDT
jgi:hypothetical protein